MANFDPLAVDFDPFDFPCFVDPASIKFNRAGDIEVKFLIRREYRDVVIDLGGTFGFPLQVTVAKWTLPIANLSSEK